MRRVAWGYYFVEAIMSTLEFFCVLILQGDNELTQQLMTQLNADKHVYLILAQTHRGNDRQQTYFIRFVVCAQNAEIIDIKFVWKTIQETADKLLA